MGKPIGDNTEVSTMPTVDGRYGIYGGRYVSEVLIAALDELRDSYSRLKSDPDFVAEIERDLRNYVGRESPLYFAERLTREMGGARILLKREDLNHTGAHKIDRKSVV